MKNDRKKTEKRGPKPDRLKLDGEWKEAAKKALKKERPAEGWPSPEEMQAKEKGPDRE